MTDIETKVKERIQTYSEQNYLDGYIKNEYMITDNEANIYLKLNDESELFDPWTTDAQLDLNRNIFEFVEDKSSMLDNNVPIILHIVGLKLDKKMEGKIKHMFKEHFAIELYKAQKTYIKYKNKIAKLIVLGVIFLISYAFLYLYTQFEFFLEVFGFMFSFSLWEAFECMIYDFAEVKEEREAITQNLLINILFEENPKNN